jgi:hypothetical protein
MGKKDYSPAMKRPKCLAPATAQVLASDLILSKMIVGMVDTFLKVLALRSFQISHETNMRRVAIAFLLPA